MSFTIGIDLGTTNSCAAFYDSQGVKLIEIDGAETILPSVVAYDDGEWLVGRDAERVARRDDILAYRNVKRLINKPAGSAQDICAHVEPGPGGLAYLRGPDRLYAPAEILSFILRHIISAAKDQLSRDITGIVIAVPADFEAAERDAVREAARLSGFADEAVRLLEEPMAAAYAYGVEEAGDKYETVAVYDFGGGTFDVSIMGIGRGEHNPLARKGTLDIGGVNFDKRLLDHIVSKKDEADDIRRSPVWSRLLKSAEEAKIALSRRKRVHFDEGFVGSNTKGGALHLDDWVTREELEELTDDLVQSTFNICKVALDEAKLLPKDIKHVILVGGMTRMPLVKRSVEAFFDQPALATLPPQTAVATGAAIEAARKDGRISTVSRSDLLARSIGLEAPGGVYLAVLRQGEPFGASAKVTVTSRRDDQPKLAIRVVEGDGAHVNEAGMTLLAEHDFPLPPGAKRTPDVEVAFTTDDVGALTVTVEDLKGDQDPFSIYEGSPP